MYEVRHLFLIAIALFHVTLTSAVVSLEESLSRRHVDTTSSYMRIKPHASGSVSDTYCGEYETTLKNNTVENQIVYTFIGIEREQPRSFKREQLCLSDFNDTLLYNPNDYFGLLDVNMNCTINKFGTTFNYTVDSVLVSFSTRSKASFFNCSETVSLNMGIPVQLLNCSSEVLSILSSRISETQIMKVVSYNYYLVVEDDFFGELTLELENRESCETDLVSVIGSFFAFVLVGAFMFLIVFAYNKKKSSTFIGNGIDVNNIHFISKPFSCAINPYSKKSKEIPVAPEKKETVSSIEINTITIQPGGTHSSFFMM